MPRLARLCCLRALSAGMAARAADLSVLATPPVDPATRILAAPFAQATGVAVRMDVWDGAADTLRARLAPGGAGADLVMMEGSELARACDEALLAKAAGDACGTSAEMRLTGLAWDRAKVTGDLDWADFFDVAKYPGQRGLRRGARESLEVALLADGVAPGDVYRSLRSTDGQDRAFRKLDRLRPYVTWYETGSQAAKSLIVGDVLMASAPRETMPAAKGRAFGWQEAGALGTVVCWAIPAGARAADAAQFVAFARLAPVAAHLAAARGTGTPGGTAPALLVDEAFWRENGAALDRRFAAWLTQ